MANSPFVVIADAIRRLEQYLRTEAMRFEKNFSYSFKLNRQIALFRAMVPPSLVFFGPVSPGG